MNIFAQSSRCSGSDGGQPGSTASCRARILAAYSLSESELKQIEAEGEERYWKPLNPPFKSLDPVVEMGSKLCR